MSFLGDFGEKQARQVRAQQQQEAARAEADTAFRPAQSVLNMGFEALKDSVEAGRAEMTRLRFTREQELEEVEVIGPWVPYVHPHSGPINLRLKTYYRCWVYGVERPYTSRSLELQGQTSSGAEPLGMIWCHEGETYRDRGLKVGETGNVQRTNPLSTEATEFYMVVQEVAAES